MNLLRDTNLRTPSVEAAFSLDDDRTISNILFCMLYISTEATEFYAKYDRTIKFYANGFLNNTLDKTYYDIIDKRIVELWTIMPNSATTSNTTGTIADTFSSRVNELFEIQDGIVIGSNIAEQIKVLAPISNEIVTLFPYREEIQIVYTTMEDARDAHADAQIAKESSIVALNAKDVSIEKAQEALYSADSANLSALFASAKEEAIGTVSVEIDNKQIDINNIKDVLLQKSLETQIAKEEAVNSALVSTTARERTEERVEFVESIVNTAIEEVSDALNANELLQLSMFEQTEKDNQFRSFISATSSTIGNQIKYFNRAKEDIIELQKDASTLAKLDKDNKILSWQGIEYTSEFIRQTQNTGILSVNNTSVSLPSKAWEQGIDTRYSALNIHNHPNYDKMPGMGWFSYITNGYMGQTRHNDYRLKSQSVGFMNTVDNEAPSVANYNFTVESMQDLFSRYLSKDLQVDEKELFRWDISYLESWWQEVDSLDDYIDDTFSSFRHTFGSIKPSYLANRFGVSRAEGKKSRLENIPFIPIASKSVDADGKTTYAVLMYRIATAQLPTLNGKVWEDVLTLEEDIPNLARFGTIDSLSSKAKFKIKDNNFDSLIENIPSLGGINEEITNHKTVDGSDISTNNKLSNYHRVYSLQSDAVGRINYTNGWNDPTLITGFTKETQVVNGVSYMVPLELILRTPLETWNPNNLTIKEKNEIVGDGTNNNPLNGFAKDFYFYHTPAEFYSGATDVDPADTGVGIKAVTGSNGDVSLNIASGIYIVLPKIENVDKRVRVRFPIYWNTQEFSLNNIMLQSNIKQMNEILDLIKLNNLGG